MICEVNNVKNSFCGTYTYISKSNTHFSQLTAQLLLMLLHVSAANRSRLQGATSFEDVHNAYACCQMPVLKYLSMLLSFHKHTT